jgi:diaminopimelate epimerase
MHGLGNDFIMVEALGRPSESPAMAGWSDQQWADLAIKVCDRHFGIGSDGVVAIMSSSVADYRMRMFNPDGSEAQMCGNGIRCFARYITEHGISDSREPRIETLAGIKQVSLNAVDGRIASVRVNMGVPIFESAQVPVRANTAVVKDLGIDVAGRRYEVSCVSMGNPHSVVFLGADEVDGLDLATIGPLFERHEMFPQRTNTEFCAVLDRQTVRMRVWERGAGETLACGTGACGTAVVAMDHGLVDRRVDVVLDGGCLTIEWEGPGQPVFMTGPAEYICDGEYYYGI